MEKKPVYESPKVSRLDEKESITGQQPGCNPAGSGDSYSCESGNNPGPPVGPLCRVGSVGDIFEHEDPLPE